MDDDMMTSITEPDATGRPCVTIELADGGRSRHWHSFATKPVADALFLSLRDGVAWEQMHLRGCPEPRLTAWMGDFAYRYSGIERRPAPVTDLVQLLVADVERVVFADFSGHFNGVLLNYYRSGADKIGLHADAERDLLVDGPIASLSFGATYRFVLRHNQTREKVVVPLTSGSLLVMEGTTQRFWKHEIPAEPRCDKGRINLTMRVHARR